MSSLPGAEVYLIFIDRHLLDKYQILLYRHPIDRNVMTAFADILLREEIM